MYGWVSWAIVDLRVEGARGHRRGNLAGKVEAGSSSIVIYITLTFILEWAIAAVCCV